LKQAKKEYKRRFKLCLDVMREIGLPKDDFELGIRVARDFYEENKEIVQFLVKSYGKPALVEMWDEKPFYFVLKYEFNFVDALDKASALSTDQIDVENGKTYGIEFVDKDGKRRNPLILHCSPCGAIERVMYALLEKAYLDEQKGKVPSLPLWLCPTQIRLVPVSDDYLDYSKKLMEKLEKEHIRVDIDDSEETVSKRIRQAEMAWIPLILVIGKMEKRGKFRVRIRESGKIKQMKLEEIVEYVKKKTQGMPFKPLSLPKLVSKRPAFVG
jgi:threonyl-tRNA synthetase